MRFFSSKVNWRLILFFHIAVVGCAQAPTKTFTTEDIDVLFLQKNLKVPIALSPQTVIVDARPAFEYAVVHPPNAINLQWRDFCDPSGSASGVLRKDQTEGARRLSLMGVTPSSQVVVVGAGLNGRGEEGRIAWTLLYLGIQDVQTAQLDSLGFRYSNTEAPPRANKPLWVPNLRSQIAVGLDEFKELMQQSEKAPAGNLDGRVVFIDVRPAEEVQLTQQLVSQRASKFHPLNLSWNTFFGQNGRPDFSVRQRLAALKIGSKDRIIVISNHGVRSGAVTYALLALGYKKAANYAGGYEELLNLNK